MDDPDVNRIHAKSGQRRIERAKQMPPAGIERPTIEPRPATSRHDEHIVGTIFVKQLSDDLLCNAIGVSVGCVNQQTTGVELDLKLLASLMLVGVASPRHRAQCHVTHHKACGPEFACLHGGTLGADLKYDWSVGARTCRCHQTCRALGG